MKKVALALVFGVLSMAGVSAQTTQKTKVKTETGRDAKQQAALKRDGKNDHQKRTPQERADMQAKRLQTQFNLTDAQASKIREMSLTKASQMQDIKAKYAEDRKAMGAEMKTVKSNWDSQLKSVLTPDQYAQYEKDRAEKMAKRQENRGKHKGQMGEHKGKMKMKNGENYGQKKKKAELED
jgi:Spy/CpxP family protein refolding chaperone